MADATRTTLASIGVGAAVFAAGAVVGAAFDRTLGAEPADEGERIESTAEENRGERNEDGEGRRRRGMWERADPTDAQRSVIDSILDHHSESMDQLQVEFRAMYNPRYWAIVDSTRAGIRNVFSDEQRMKYDSMTARYDARRRNDDGRDGWQRENRSDNDDRDDDSRTSGDSGR